MKIKKVDDKPIVIHTKEKAKIHAHEPKKAKIKGSNIYTVERGPKVHDAKANEMDKKASAKLMLQKSAGGKSTIHQSEAKDKGLSKFKRNIRESGASIKTKNTNLHIAGRTGALAAGAVTEQVEGGHEVSQAAYLAYEASQPVTGTASKGAALFRKKAAAEAKKRIKKVEAGKKLAKKTAKKAAKDTAKAVAKETAKETAKTTAKVATKTATKAAATAAGTAVAPGVGTAIGMAAGYAAGVSIEVKDEKMTNRSRKIKFFLDKMKAQENQTDSVAKLVKDLIVRKAITWVKAAAPIGGLVLLLLVLVVAMIAVPVIAVIAILYNSPFALFLPPLESGDTVQTVTSAYVQEFNRDVNTKVNEHTGYDLGELVYVDYEGMEENPSNYYDIMAVYMVKHGVGDTATVMNDTSKGWLQAVVNDMCSYTTSTGTKDVEETDADGNVTVVHCTYDPETKSGSGFNARKVKGTIHWVSAAHAVSATVRLYENIVDEEKGVYNEDGSLNLNPNSLTVLKNCMVEENLAGAKAYDSFQFVRQGFFCVDAKDSTPEQLVFNRIVSLKSSFKLPTA